MWLKEEFFISLFQPTGTVFVTFGSLAGKLSSLVSGVPILQAMGLENVTTTNSDTGVSSKQVKYQSLKRDSEERFPAWCFFVPAAALLRSEADLRSALTLGRAQGNPCCLVKTCFHISLSLKCTGVNTSILLKTRKSC